MKMEGYLLAQAMKGKNAALNAQIHYSAPTQEAGFQPRAKQETRQAHGL